MLRGDLPAITGIGAAFSGAPDAETFWQNVLHARSGPVESLCPRWNVSADQILGPVGAPNRAYVDRAFCVGFEGIDDAETDLQVRLGRHVVSATLRDAERSGRPMARATTALVVATSWSAPSYFEHDLALTLGAPRPAGPCYAPDLQLDAIGGPLGLLGPRLSVDTACASSLYAIDVARRLIERGEASAAIVVGLNVLLTPFLFVGFSKLMALSPTSEMLPFAEHASGIVPGEGAGAVLIEPLGAARAAGRRVYAVVRGLGLSADGSERSVFAPGEQGQYQSYERAYAGLDPSEVDYVEAHGTATPAGDATELGSLERFFGSRRSLRGPLAIGSVKALVGHTLAAAGMASVLKVVLMLRERTIPKELSRSPHPELPKTHLRRASAAEPWHPTAGRPRRAGVSCFGFGGSNAHLVLESDEEDYAAPSAGKRVPCLPIAIVDAEFAFGSAIGAAECQGALSAEPSLASRVFSSRIKLDGSGLRAGPNFLKRMDALQVLVSHLTAQLLARHPAERSSSGTASVVTSNLGGEMGLRLMRASSLRSRRDAGTAGRDDFTVEAIASSLPSMCSGYVAYHFDLRAFHETLAGGPATFWTSLALAEHWLSGECKTLILGAARLIKSPCEWQSANVPDGEGAAVFLLKSLAHAERDGDRVVAVVRAIVPGHLAQSWEEACAFANVPCESVELRETSWLTPHAKVDRAAQATTGFLAEATGIESLGRALFASARRTSIEVREPDGHLLWTVFIDRRLPFTPPACTWKLPVEIAFERKLPAPPEDEARSPRAETWLAWLESAERGVRSYFAAQRVIASRLEGPDEKRISPPMFRRSPDNVVVDDLQETREGRSARLRVDDGHPYFFDHPLDHVPGILLVEGISQLAAHRSSPDEHYLRKLRLRFKRFCEKDSPVEISLTGTETFSGKITQLNAIAATFEGELAPVGEPPAPDGAEAASPPQKKEAAKWLHKAHADNVFVTPLENVDGVYRCGVLSPPLGHIFAEGSPFYHSALFLLEASRQILMLGAHKAMGIPLGVPMNLLSIDFSVTRPIARATPLRVRLEPGSVHRLDTVLLAESRVVLEGTHADLGEVRLKVQVVDPETYKTQRQSNP